MGVVRAMAKDHVCKEVSSWVIGLITLVYVVAELAIALYEGSLTLLSDGFHNLSDVLSLGIAFWASKASRRGSSDAMSYGWARTEILGALTNGVFLLSLCLYTSLEAIPQIIAPTEEPAGYYFVAVAAAGLIINTLGTVVFAITGQAHGHSHAGGGGHGHSHGGHGHAHGDEKESLLADSHSMKNFGSESSHGHSHGDDHGHSHSHGDDHKEDHGHSHSHGHGKPKKKRDMNVQAVFLHYLGDMVSSFFVLIAGVLLLVFQDDKWIQYIDPVTSLIICGLILITTLPLVRGCLHILLQSTPKHINLDILRSKIKNINGVMGIHDFHAWQLTDGMIITSLHVVCDHGCDFSEMARKIKKVLHKAGIHSTAIQPEFVHPQIAEVPDSCAENCVEDCKEDWCCKSPAEAKKKRRRPSSGDAIN